MKTSKATLRRRARELAEDGREVQSTRKVGSRTYTFYSGTNAAPAKRTSPKPKPKSLGSGLAAGAAKTIKDAQKKKKKRIDKMFK